MRFGALVVVAVAIGACSRRGHDTTTLTGAKIDVLDSPRESEAFATTRRWDLAMSRHDVALLHEVYARHVEFYGVRMRREQVLQALSAAFADDPSFTQSVGELRAVPPRVDLKRTFVARGVRHTEAMQLELSREDGRVLVLVQSGPRRASGQCALLAERVALSSRRATRMLDVNDDAEARRVLAPPEWPTYAIAIIDRTAPRSVTIGWLDVSAETGETVDAFTGDALSTNADLTSELRRCRP